ncbi:DNA-binding MarR family transcriptional regulator [Kribbella antiqua]|uniref:DNA-binding MarR family transcriptional regulator n=1 Tax=Kribbella antiqua TaxID=2512217 RepID=A0A4R2I741_9ACTN|nr:MarR family winged helix-turn-helix transcriptional regulator [Kribbella antiqua]TCO40143.1 DNA-binding MarR family transcriptional regulator [Kribbella antiqua]
MSDRLGYLLKHVQARLTEEQAKALQPFGINGRDLAVLAAVASGEPLSQLEVAGRLRVDRTSIGDLLDSLEERGLVERRRSPEDRRRNVVVLTNTGEDVFADAEQVRLEVEREFLAPLPDRDRFREDLRLLLGE